MRLIDRNRVIEKLNILRNLCPDLRISKIKRDLFHDIEQLPIIEAEPKWNPYPENSPPRKEAWYWVTIKTENSYKVERELYSFDNHGIPGFYTFAHIVAWMPYTTPEPYEGK